jgi:hypothetical protein
VLHIQCRLCSLTHLIPPAHSTTPFPISGVHPGPAWAVSFRLVNPMACFLAGHGQSACSASRTRQQTRRTGSRNGGRNIAAARLPGAVALKPTDVVLSSRVPIIVPLQPWELQVLSEPQPIYPPHCRAKSFTDRTVSLSEHSPMATANTGILPTFGSARWLVSGKGIGILMSG